MSLAQVLECCPAADHLLGPGRPDTDILFCRDMIAQFEISNLHE